MALDPFEKSPITHSLKLLWFLTHFSFFFFWTENLAMVTWNWVFTLLMSPSSYLYIPSLIWKLDRDLRPSTWQTGVTTCYLKSSAQTCARCFKGWTGEGSTALFFSVLSSQLSGMPIFCRTAEICFFCTKILTPEIRLNPRR